MLTTIFWIALKVTGIAICVLVSTVVLFFVSMGLVGIVVFLKEAVDIGRGK